MDLQTLTINALSHCDWKDCPEELVKAANGKCVMLVREDDNVDPHAVRVHFHARVASTSMRVLLAMCVATMRRGRDV